MNRNSNDPDSDAPTVLPGAASPTWASDYPAAPASTQQATVSATQRTLSDALNSRPRRSDFLPNLLMFAGVALAVSFAAKLPINASPTLTQPTTPPIHLLTSTEQQHETQKPLEAYVPAWLEAFPTAPTTPPESPNVVAPDSPPPQRRPLVPLQPVPRTPPWPTYDQPTE